MTPVALMTFVSYWYLNSTLYTYTSITHGTTDLYTENGYEERMTLPQHPSLDKNSNWGMIFALQNRYECK